MVIRVSALIACFCIGILFFSIHDTTAGGPPVPTAPQYQCAPPVCGVPACGPRPFGLCSGVLGICSRVCGTVLGCPAALASAILDPPPPVFPRRRGFCSPPGCAPALVCAPPVCMPPPVKPITKVKPQAAVAVAPPPVACAPAPVPFRMARCVPRRPILGCAGLCAAILDMPLRLCSGLLSVSDGPLCPVVGAFETTMTGYEQLW